MSHDRYTVWFHHQTWNLFRFILIGSNKSKFYPTDNPSFGPTLTIFNQSPMILHCPNLIFYHRGELGLANSIGKWAKNKKKIIFWLIFPLIRLLGIGPAVGGDQRQIMALSQEPCYFVFWTKTGAETPKRPRNGLITRKKPKWP